MRLLSYERIFNIQTEGGGNVRLAAVVAPSIKNPPTYGSCLLVMSEAARDQLFPERDEKGAGVVSMPTRESINESNDQIVKLSDELKKRGYSVEGAMTPTENIGDTALLAVEGDRVGESLPPTDSFLSRVTREIAGILGAEIETPGRGSLPSF